MKDVRAKMGVAGIMGAVFIALVIMLMFGSNFFYIMKAVEANEMGVQMRAGQIVDVVGPGIYNDFGLYVKLHRINMSAIHFSVSDEEVITLDKQRVGVVVAGDLFRPTNAETIRELWPRYNRVLLNDAAAMTVIEEWAKQAMKVCVGSYTFDQNVIGEARDVLRICIEAALDELVTGYGMDVRNVTVPNVILSADAQAAYDAITASRLLTEQARQQELQAAAQAKAQLALEIGEVQVAEGRNQELARQMVIQAQLRRDQAVAEVETTEAQKQLELRAAQLDLEINRVKVESSRLAAEAELAHEILRASLFTENPGYAQVTIAGYNADALQNVQKLLIIPAGAIPTIVLPSDTVAPVLSLPPTSTLPD